VEENTMPSIQRRAIHDGPVRLADARVRRRSRLLCVARAGLVAGFLLIGPALVQAQSGSPFDLTWNTIDGGGPGAPGFSSGGAFELGGTIGQPDASVTVRTGADFELAGGFWFTKIACNAPPQDSDADADVDLTDFGRFQTCFNGPNRAYGAGGSSEACLCLDQDEDGDVDLGDFGRFQACFNGPNRPATC
jgi:hypothetical protein